MISCWVWRGLPNITYHVSAFADMCLYTVLHGWVRWMEKKSCPIFIKKLVTVSDFLSQIFWIVFFSIAQIFIKNAKDNSSTYSFHNGGSTPFKENSKGDLFKGITALLFPQLMYHFMLFSKSLILRFITFPIKITIQMLA